MLLAGDTGIISERIVYDASLSLDTPTDLYYADIDTDWNPNRDYLIKDHEVAAAFADVFVGRAPVNDQEQADVFIDKILIYEKSAPSDYVNEVLFLAGPFGTCEDGETFPEHKEYLNATFLPDYIQLYRLYTPETFYVPKNPIYLPVFSDLDNAGVT